MLLHLLPDLTGRPAIANLRRSDSLPWGMNHPLACSLVLARGMFGGQRPPGLYFETVAPEHCEHAQGTKKKLLM